MAKKPDREETFKRLAESRTQKALEQIRLLGNLTDKSNYKYSKKDFYKITAALYDAISDLEERIDNDGLLSSEVFHL